MASQLVQKFTMISGFRRDVDEICGLLGYYTVSCGNLPVFMKSKDLLLCSQEPATQTYLEQDKPIPLCMVYL
jgi:hypothetical protein